MEAQTAMLAQEEVPQEKATDQRIFFFSIRTSSVRSLTKIFSSKRILIATNRLFSHHPSYSIPLLHASASEDMLSALQCVVPTRCAGWSSSTALPAINTIRSRTGYGHRPLHHRVLARLPKLRVPKMGSLVSGPHQLRPGEPLHAYVCYIEHGRL